MEARAEGEWLGGHLFYAGQDRAAADRVLREVVRPFVDEGHAAGWLGRWFFIRYREGGAHVRLRLHGEPEVLGKVVRPALEAHVEARLPPGLAGRPSEAGEPSPASAALRWVPYEPETGRYGGPMGVRLAEELFHHSSEAALGLLESFESGDSGARFGVALAAMVLLLGSLTRDRGEAAALARVHRDYWTRASGLDGAAPEVRGRYEAGYAHDAGVREQVEAIWAALEEGPAALPEPLDGYAAGAGEVAARLRRLQEAGGLDTGGGPIPEWRDALRALAPSYLHMMNNRLGVFPPEEARLAHFAARALQAGTR